MRTLGTLLFPRFELLDVAGPLEILGNQNLDPARFRLVMVAEKAGLVPSAQGPSFQADFGLDDCPPLDVVMVPGGPGTRIEVDNPRLRDWLTRRAATAEMVLSVCTGASLLARAGLLDGHRATTNKRAFDWVVSQGPKVQWVREARWVEDGRFVTSSGVSAGIDMAVQVLSRVAGRDEAERIARVAEYNWQSDPSVDPFAALYEKKD